MPDIFIDIPQGAPTPGAGPAEITYLAWNVKVQHILAACTSAGQTNVFDLRRQKPIAILRDLNRLAHAPNFLFFQEQGSA